MSNRDRRPGPPPADDEPNDGRTQMLNVGKPAPEPQRRRAPPTADDEPVEAAEDAPGATMMIKVGEELPPPRPPPRKPAPASPPPRPARRAQPEPQPPPEALDGATQMLDVRTVPTPDEVRQQAAKKAALAQAPGSKKMPSEIEVPVEHLHEQIHEKAHEGGHGSFNMQVALSSALLAVLAAASALYAGHFANEAMVEQIKASDNWAFFQAKSIKSSILQSKMELLQSLGRSQTASDQEKIDDYAKEQKDISKKAKELEAESHHHMAQHQVLARVVTLLQISIALSAIAVLTRKKQLWYLSLLGGAAGLVILAQALFFTH